MPPGLRAPNTSFRSRPGILDASSHFALENVEYCQKQIVRHGLQPQVIPPAVDLVSIRLVTIRLATLHWLLYIWLLLDSAPLCLVTLHLATLLRVTPEWAMIAHFADKCAALSERARWHAPIPAGDVLHSVISRSKSA